uniref:DNA-directed DNA polymerase n=1 Tax=Staphylothermus marinus TaxID=2280 RepID=A0A7J3KEU1_STAMA
MIFVAKWFLDVKVLGDKCFLELYDDMSRSIERVMNKLKFYGYVLVKEPEEIARILLYENLVNEAWVEDWYKPPYYRDKCRVLVYTTNSFENYRYLYSLFKRRGFHIVNNYPHPLIEALYRAGLKPLTKLYGGSTWDPREHDPVIDYATIRVENGFYIVETNDGVEAVQSIRDLIEILRTIKPLLVFSNSLVYFAVINEDEGVVKTPYSWITIGSYTPHIVFEWCRLSYTPLSLMNNATIGRLLSTIEVLRARDWKYLVDREWSRVEGFRTIDELFVWDRGGSIHQPKPGLYWNVCQIDFKSLYPSIIVKLNVSGETVNDPYCAKQLITQYTPHKVCLDRDGLVASVISNLIDLKDLYEKLFDETRLKLYDERRSAVKWILVASFGYLGYRNSIFGSVSAHEVVTSTSRFVTAEAIRKILKLGFRVIHVLVDSLFVEGVENLDECREIAEVVGDELGYRLKVDAHYIWLYIPRSVTTGLGSSNKYYGVLSTGGLKIKGLTIIRRDIPIFIKQIGSRVFEELASAKNAVELRKAICRAVEVIENAERMLMNREVDIKLLVFSREGKVSYRKPPRYAILSKPPYMYVATRTGFTPLNALEDLDEVDYSYYVKLLNRIKEELPVPEEIN